MFAFVLRRIGQSLFVMLVVAIIAFSMFRFVGDPVHNMVGQQTSMEDREKLREALGLNDPFYVQFYKFIKDAVKGDFGTSYRHGRPVSEIIAERLPATLELSLVAVLFALCVGIPMGVYTGIKKDSILSKFFLTTSLIGVSMPVFLIGILMIWIFAVELHWLPPFGRGDVVELGKYWSTGFLTISGLKALILPSITLGLFQMTLIMRLVRSEMLEVLRTDYIKFARARGLKNSAIYFGHALKNTLLPVITITGLQIGTIIAFAIITETVFNWPGMGQLFIQAINNVDIPIMAAYLMLVALIFVIINLIVDALYFWVDPRLKTGNVVARST
ncbi:MAG: ABC transporter permease [Alphaproteobacteria bacterium]|nr:ABC transporter permease [Alphaproteobacteria bacterium]